MTKFILRWAINAIALYLAVLIVPGIVLRSNLVSLIWLALIFGVVNALFGPLIKLLTCPLILLTLGLFTLVINTFLFWLTSVIGQSFGIGLIITDPVWWNAFLGGLVVSIVSVIMTLILKDELKEQELKQEAITKRGWLQVAILFLLSSIMDYSILVIHQLEPTSSLLEGWQPPSPPRRRRQSLKHRLSVCQWKEQRSYLHPAWYEPV